MHGKKTIFIDENGSDMSDIEHEANRFASDLLIPAATWTQFERARDFSAASVKRFAGKQGIAPGIVVGRLQHEKAIPFSFLNDLKERLDWA